MSELCFVYGRERIEIYFLGKGSQWLLSARHQQSIQNQIRQQKHQGRMKPHSTPIVHPKEY
jgi:hypothetical protein